ncbi:Fe-S oxidoreductase [Thermosyntropha lipolytica DSM 11003]|uniref:Fe-S oxidoreductase n=1 Tax=Thermosyntropha lipolytica DSM 11003 TaxID=1123382 RepID=A0A1M5MFG0_9FIRM|nr:(Fe-S)-binding protein [Thermosyntropha lipolytica]SHG75986.1 Fe-S oxidoreductase [Thermosyntropha lipolytica DSM 11003]
MSSIILSENLTGLFFKEAEKCINCGACTAGCPLYAYSGLSPQDLLSQIAREGQISLDIPYSCTLCGYCSHICPEGVKLDQLMRELRSYAFNEKGRPARGINYAPVKSHQKYSFSPLFSTTRVPSNYNGVVFFPGCSLPSFRPDLTEKTYLYLQEKMSGTGIMLKCCAGPTLAMGDEKKFQQYYHELEQEFAQWGVKKVITACPNCYKTIKENSGQIEAVSLWEILREIGIPEGAANRKNKPHLSLALHDPCPTRSYPTVHDSVRFILNQLGIDFAEFKFNRQKTLCCGAGGMLGITNPPAALSWMKKRAGETKAEIIITYCQECAVSMQKGGKKSLHLLDLIFNPGVWPNEKKNPTSLRRWYNRYRIKKAFNKFNPGGSKDG